MKKVIVTGVTGQDGSYLAELLLGKGYEVHGIVRRSSSFNTSRIDSLINDKIYRDSFRFHHGDLTDQTNLTRLLATIKPDEIYNLGAQSHVKVSFELPEYTAEVNGLGTLKLLESLRQLDIDCRFYQASTSELYGKVNQIPQNETTRFYPRSPYAVSKLYGYWAVVNYREAYGLHASNGILFNHESPRRGETFVTRKVTLGVARIKLNMQEFIEIGNLDAERDWGYAPEYVEGMWQMLQQDDPGDYVLATGSSHTVREFIEQVFNAVDMPIYWEGVAMDQVGKDKRTNQVRVKVNKNYFRPTEVDKLVGSYSKAKNVLGWSPKTDFVELAKIMAKADLDLVESRGY